MNTRAAAEQLFTTIPALGEYLSTAKVRSAFLVVQNEDSDEYVRVITVNNDAEFRVPLAYVLMCYLEGQFGEPKSSEAAVPRAERRRLARSR